MPPPKKPKNGPTSVEQFLSREELQKMEEAAPGVAPARAASAPGGATLPARIENRKGSSDGDSGGGHGEGSRQKSSSTPSFTFSSSVSSASASGVKGLSSKTATTTSSYAASGVEASYTPGVSNARIGLLRRLFSRQETNTVGEVPPPPPTTYSESRALHRKGRNGDSKTSSMTDSGGGGMASREWLLKRSSSGGGGKFSSGAADHDASAGFQPVHMRAGGRHGGGSSSSSSNLQGDETILSSKVLMEHTSYLTSLIKESPPVSSGAMAAPYLERVALNSGKLLHGLMGAPAPPAYIHAAFQLPLMDTSTSGQTSVLAYLAAQGAHHHPHSPLPPLPPLPLPRCCVPSSLPLVDAANTTPLTSFSSSFSSPLSSGSTAVPASGINEPFDLSVKKLSGSSGSVESESTGSDKTLGELASSSRPGSSTGDLATGIPPSASLGASSTNNSSTSTSPAVASTPPTRGDRDGSSSPGLPRGLTPTNYLMDFRGPGLAGSPVGKLFGIDAAGAAGMGQRPFPGAPQPSPGDSRISPNREPSDSKASTGDSSHGHSRLASGATPGPTGASPGGGGAGPSGVGGVPGMPGHSLMSGSGHLQAPTSTTPEGGGAGLHPGFLSMEPHASPLGPGEIHIKQEISAGSSTPAKLCQVCNDNASGFHYGVWSCEGCKAFFKRSIQGPVDYMCPATNNCTIDKHRRKSCQACRLRKCYEVGMNKGSQRKDRKSSGSSTTPKGKRCRADSTDTTDSATNGGGASASKNAKRMRSASILEALQKADLPALESFHNHDLPLSKVHLLNTLIKLADRELVYLINWAKHVPGYTDLTLSDQVHLIECCWMELLLLNCAFRSMEHDGKRLVFAPDFHLDRHLWSVMGMTEILEQVSAVSEQMVRFVVTKEELLLLQATVLVNAEVRRLSSFEKIIEMHQMIVDALVEVATKTHADSARRVPTLLLLLTHIRQAGERGIAYFQSLKHEGCVNFCDLLTEMLDAHNSATTAASTSTTVAASLPSTSSADVDRKNLNPANPAQPQLAMGAAVMAKRSSGDDGNINSYV